MISQVTIQKIFDTIDIYEVVSDFITLRKSGANYLGLCPFHNEKTPSLSVSPAKGIYKCFGCGKAGNAVNFVMEHEQLNYYETLRYLAKKYHIEVEETQITSEQKLLKDTRENLLIVIEYANKFFQDSLHNTNIGKKVVLPYLKERKLGLDIVKKFTLGFNPNKENSFSKSAIKKGYKKEFLLQSGLSFERNSQLIDRFQRRLIFPIQNLSGKVVGFGGRILKNNSKSVKYINSPESVVYNKSRLLYGLFHAKESIRKNDQCFLVEGYTDVLSLHQAGIENVVASSGTSLTLPQILQIKRITKNVTLIYDGDNSGIKASFRNIDLMLENDINLSVVPLPAGEDPDSFSQSISSHELKNYLTQSEQNFILYKASFIYQDVLNDPVKKSNAIMDIVRSISAVTNQIIKAEYIKKCSQIFNVDEKILYAEMSKILVSKKKKYKAALTPDTPPISISKNLNPCDKIEKELIRYLLIYGNHSLFKDDKNKTIDVATYIFNELGNDEINAEDEIHQFIFDEYKTMLENEDFNALKYFTLHSNEKISKLIAELLVEPYQLSTLWKNNSHLDILENELSTIIPQILYAYKQKKIQLMQNELQRKIVEAKNNNDTKKINELLKEKIWLDKTKSQIAKLLGNRTII